MPVVGFEENNWCESHFSRGRPVRPSQDYSKPKTKFEALLQTQAAEVRCTALEKTSLNHNFETDFS